MLVSFFPAAVAVAVFCLIHPPVTFSWLENGCACECLFVFLCVLCDGQDEKEKATAKVNTEKKGKIVCVLMFMNVREQ